MTIELRIVRTFKWVRDPHQEVRYGGPPPHQLLEPTDTLQMRASPSSEWVNVPIIEAEKPPHPFDKPAFAGPRTTRGMRGLSEQVSTTTER